MIKTQRLFDADSKLLEFDAAVLECTEREDGCFDTILDKTAFFPNEGGQACDTGTIGGAAVLSADEKDGVIIHKTAIRFAKGERVCGNVDWEPRLRKMQNHTGEHIISGLIYKEFGYNNVGFHLGADDVTADFDGELCEADVRRIERLANDVVFACRKITARYPEPCELSKMDYRSKLDLTEGVRIVEIEDVDRCACCAPHVYNTGEVGLIKILDYIRYKGGVRIHIQCGLDALDDYNLRYAEMRRVSMAISAKQLEIGDGVERVLEECGRLKGEISVLKREIMAYKLASLEYTSASICLFENSDDMLAARNFVNEAVRKTGAICALFCGNDSDGYKYIMASDSVDLKALLSDINSSLGGRGGGSAKMVQGSCNAKEAQIKEYFKNK
ncbi:MAG: alanyl-tRNA editing protein [Clostridia bacterium]|nr:alanyl-tRNA editing protein [Clostridia bacterium]